MQNKKNKSYSFNLIRAFFIITGLALLYYIFRTFSQSQPLKKAANNNSVFEKLKPQFALKRSEIYNLLDTKIINKDENVKSSSTKESIKSAFWEIYKEDPELISLLLKCHPFLIETHSQKYMRQQYQASAVLLAVTPQGASQGYIDTLVLPSNIKSSDALKKMIRHELTHLKNAKADNVFPIRNFARYMEKLKNDAANLKSSGFTQKTADSATRGEPVKLVVPRFLLQEKLKEWKEGQTYNFDNEIGVQLGDVKLTAVHTENEPYDFQYADFFRPELNAETAIILTVVPLNEKQLPIAKVQQIAKKVQATPSVQQNPQRFFDEYNAYIVEDFPGHQNRMTFFPHFERAVSEEQEQIFDSCAKQLAK